MFIIRHKKLFYNLTGLHFGLMVFDKIVLLCLYVKSNYIKNTTNHIN